MATAAATAPVAEVSDAAPKKGKKKLIIIIAAVLLVVLAGGGAAVYMMKQKAAAAEAAAAEGEDGEEAAPAKGEHAKKEEHKGPPVFVPLDPFIVNLADKDTERYAQIGITLQVDDAHFADELKLYLPAVRNGILMVLAHKNSKELLERSGKERLAREIMREAVRPMGIEIAAEEESDTSEHAADPDAEEAPKPKKKKKPKAEPVHNPVSSVNFSSFIIQ
jgi:flagellar FliL protein